MSGDLASAGLALRPADSELGEVISRFLWWEPEHPRTLRKLVRAVARLCRYLREEVIGVLEQEEMHQGDRPFTALANEWREILFPRLTDPRAFADAYSQTIVFALLLARHAGVSFDGRTVPDIANKLGKQHALVGRALAVLTDPRAADNLVIMETLRRVIGAVDWDELDIQTGEAHALLYETFLEEYDPVLRRRSGSYYTPDPVARGMVRFVDEILRRRLARPWGLAADDVIVVDPAMGTGTFLVEVVDAVADTVAGFQGLGATAQRLRELFQRRLIGFERQVTPYAVAELRLHEALKTRYGVDVPEKEMRFLTDTFEDPDTQQLQFGRMYQELQDSREGANKVKRDVPVMVVIGNPPYLERAHTLDPAPWIERRRDVGKPADVAFRPSIDEFRMPGNGRHEYKLSDTFVFYWRWATWKVFDAHPDQPAGIVAFITPSSYLSGQAFAGMRAYLRRVADEGWIIDVTPEGHQPPVSTRIFRGVQQPLCIGIFARVGPPDEATPARVRYRAVRGEQQSKFDQILHLDLEHPAWVECPSGWQDPFLHGGRQEWASYPALDDLMPWHRPGVKPNRTWVYAPMPSTLRRRWSVLVSSPPAMRDELLKSTRDRTPDSTPPAIPGMTQPRCPLRNETRPTPSVARVAFRSFDRQHLLLDPRVIDYVRSELWAVRKEPQVFVSEQHAHPISDGPGLTFSSLVPDMHHYQGRGGRVLPLYRDLASGSPNLQPGLLQHLARRLTIEVSVDDFLAYIAAVVAHPAYTHRFRDDLKTPGIRIPLTGEPAVWRRAVEIGSEVIWLHTYGERFVDPENGRPAASPRLARDESPRVVSTIPYHASEMPDAVEFDLDAQSVLIGLGRITPVSPSIWTYSVGGMQVVKHWIGYRLRNPHGKKASSPLDEITTDAWPQEFTNELLDLLHVVGRLIKLHPSQEQLLNDVELGSLISAADLGSN